MQIRVIFICFLCFLAIKTYSQDGVSPSNVSDAQIEQGVKQAQAQGYTPQQVEAMARAKGLSDSEISNLRNRVNQIQTESGSETIDEAIFRDEFQELADVEKENLEDETTEKKSGQRQTAVPVFGSQLFSQSNLTFAPSSNIPTPKDYVLSTGDELQIDIWGASEKTYLLSISPEGNVRIPGLGPIQVSGLTVATAEKFLISRLVSIYAGLANGERTDTYARVSLGRIRSIKVNIIGEVVKPGTYTISSLSTILHALYNSGGPNSKGSYRNIELYRNGQLFKTFDVYDFLNNGELKNNVVLQDQDVIIIPIYKKRVQIKGEVKTPMIYELEENEDLLKLISYADGFTDYAYQGWLTITRLEDDSKKILTIKSRKFDLFDLKSGDVVNVARKKEYLGNVVTILGSVQRPGEYEYVEGLSVSELVNKAEGLEPDAFDLRGQITRTNPDYSFLNIDFSLDSMQNLKLIPNDIVVIKSKYAFEDQKNVRIIGNVRSSGVYQLEDNLTVEGLLFKAGGLQASALKNVVYISRRIPSENNPDDLFYSEIIEVDYNSNLVIGKEFLLKPNDIVIVRQDPNYETEQIVNVSGEVKFPGYYPLENKNVKISDILLKAGGLTDWAYINGGKFYRDGDLIRINLLDLLEKPGLVNDMLLRNGDSIFIPKLEPTVSVNGAVWQPGNLVYTSNKVLEYIDKSGGYIDMAWTKRIYVTYANGSSSRTSRFLWFKSYPKVEPGCKIVVPQKPVKQSKVTPQGWIALSSGMATLSLLIINIIDKIQ